MITESKTEETTQPTPPSRSWIQAPFIAGIAYFAYNALLPLIHVDYIHTPLGVRRTLVIGSTLVFMLLQLWLPRTIITRDWRLAKSVWVALLFGSVAAFVAFRLHPSDMAPSMKTSVELAIQGLTLTVFLASLGWLLSRIVREAKMLLPISLVAMAIDVLGAMTPKGFTSQFVQNNPHFVQQVSVPVATIGVLQPLGYIGPGDALFIAFFLGVIYRNRLNMSRTFWTMFGLLTVTMLSVLAGIGDIAALLPMGIAVIATNIRSFKFDRSEVFAMIYAGVLAVALAGGFFLMYSQKYGSHKHRNPAPAHAASPDQQTAPSAKKN